MTATADRTCVIDAARRYMELGWPAFPLYPIVDGRCGCAKPNCGDAGKHPISTGWQRTIASPAAVDGLWADRHGQRGIGLACGHTAGLWGLDVDPRHSGTRSVRELQAKHGPLPRTVTAHTGGGGWHLLFRWADGIRNSAGKIGAGGVDVRGHGGYLVLPPSQHASGGRYQWVFGPDTTEVAEAPDWLLELARRPPRAVEKATADPDELVPHGQRHDHLKTFGLRLLKAGVLTERLMEAHLWTHFRETCEPHPAPTGIRALAAWLVSSGTADTERAAADFVARWTTKTEGQP